MTTHNMIKRTGLGLAAATALLLLSPAAFAQTSDSMEASVTLETPMTVSATENLTFGTIALSATDTVTLVMDAAGNSVDVTGITGGAFHRGDHVFGVIDITGAVGAAVTISVPAPLELATGVDITSFNLSAGSATLTDGTAQILVGGTLQVASTAVPGLAQGIFDVTVEYQ